MRTAVLDISTGRLVRRGSEGTAGVQARTEWGVRWSDGSVTQYPEGPGESSYSRAIDALAIDPDAALVSRRVVTYEWQGRDILTFPTREDARVWIGDSPHYIPADAPADDAAPSVVRAYELRLMAAYERGMKRSHNVHN